MTNKATKLSIYLLKKDENIDNVIKNIDDISKKINRKDIGGGTFFYKESSLNTPSWVKSFFDNELLEINLKNKSTSAVYIKTVDVDDDKRTFLIPFGYGHSMIDDIFCEGDFGMRLTLNIVEKSSIKQVKTRALTKDPKNTIAQLGQKGALSDFGIDIEQDLIEEVTGIPEESYIDTFGSGPVTGRVRFSVSKKTSINDIDNFLRECLFHYQKDTYKIRYPFMENVKHIRSPQFLNDKLIEHLKEGKENDDVKVWMAIPDSIEWDRVKGFLFPGRGNDLVDDISFDYFKQCTLENNIKKLDIQFLNNKKVVSISKESDMIDKRWSLFQCLCCEIHDNGNDFILSNANWYKIDNNFAKGVQKDYEKIMEESKGQKALLEAYKGEHEKEYNKRLAKSSNELVLMDRVMIPHGQTGSTIEFCDVYDKNKKSFIHVKIYHGSGPLSHLFAQARISGKLFLYDPEFRKKVHKKEAGIPEEDMALNVNTKLDASKYKVIYAIISDKEEDLNLPFFSKVNLRNEINQLRVLGFQEIYLIKIQRTQQESIAA